MRLMAPIFGIFSLIMLTAAIVAYFATENEFSRWTNVFFCIAVAAIFATFAAFSRFLSQANSMPEKANNGQLHRHSGLVYLVLVSVATALLTYVLVSWLAD